MRGSQGVASGSELNSTDAFPAQTFWGAEEKEAHIQISCMCACDQVLMPIHYFTALIIPFWAQV